MWDSKYQQWNSTRLGPKRDFMREWEKTARDADMRFGITFHHEYSWWWQTAFQSDFTGDMAGVPYDGNLTAEDGRGEWWEGLDPRYLYGVMNVLPGGRIGSWQAEHPFHTTDFRFTKGKDGALYAWCMTVPAAGEKLSIRSLGSASGLMEGKIASVELLGADTKVEWSQSDGALEIVYPDSAKLNTAAGFRIVCE